MPRYTQPRKTWSYTNDFKIKAVRLSYQEGLQVKQVAEGLGIHPFMLSRWRKEVRDGKLKEDRKGDVTLFSHIPHSPFSPNPATSPTNPS